MFVDPLDDTLPGEPVGVILHHIRQFLQQSHVLMELIVGVVGLVVLNDLLDLRRDRGRGAVQLLGHLVYRGLVEGRITVDHFLQNLKLRGFPCPSLFGLHHPRGGSAFAFGVAVAFAVLHLLGNAQGVPFAVPLNAEDKFRERFHPELVNFDDQLRALILVLGLTHELDHFDFQVLEEVDVAAQVAEVVEVLIETGNDHVVDIDFREGPLVNLADLLLDGDQLPFQRFRILVLEELLQVKGVFYPVLAGVVLPLEGRHELGDLLRLVEVNKVGEPRVGLVVHHHVQIFLLVLRRQILSILVGVEGLQGEGLLLAPLGGGRLAGEVLVDHVALVIIELLQVKHALFFIHSLDCQIIREQSYINSIFKCKAHFKSIRWKQRVSFHQPPIIVIDELRINGRLKYYAIFKLLLILISDAKVIPGPSPPSGGPQFSKSKTKKRKIRAGKIK